MKKIFFFLSVSIVFCFIFASQSYALSFVQGTQFLEADNRQECEAQGGNYLEWAGQIYCTKPPVYTSFADFISANPVCKTATDGCNTVQIWNGEQGAATQMYCEDVYGENGQEEWSCLDGQLEEERLGFLSENDRNQYYNFQERLGEENTDRIQKIIADFGDKTLEANNYDIQQSLAFVEKVLQRFNMAINKITQSYPADASMSQTDTVKYYILTVAKVELQIMQNRWIRNSLEGGAQ